MKAIPNPSSGYRPSAVLRPRAAFLAMLITLSPATRALGQTGWGNALSFDGAQSRVVITNFGSILPTNEITVEFWQNMERLHPALTFSLEPFAATNACEVLSTNLDGTMNWDYGNITNGGRLSYKATNVLVGMWNHFAFVAKAGTNMGFMQVYINGLLQTNKHGAGSPSLGNRNLSLGGLGGVAYFAGKLDEFRIWSEARSADQLQQNMWRPLSGAESNLVAYWRFNEAGGPIACDGSTNHLDGVLVSGPTRAASGVSWLGPYATNLPPSGTTMTSVTLQATVNPNGTNTGAWFEWGPDTRYGNTNPVPYAGAGSANVAVQTSLTGLTPGATYHYRVVATNRFALSVTKDMLVTLPAPAIVQTLPADGQSLTNGKFGATLRGTVNPNGHDTYAWFEYGDRTDFSETNYGQATAVLVHANGNTPLPMSSIQGGLWPSDPSYPETKHFHTVASNELGVVTGPDLVYWPTWGSSVQAPWFSLEDTSCCSDQTAPFRASNVTMEAWIYWQGDTGTPQPFFCKAFGTPTNYSYALWYEAGAVHARASGGAALDYAWNPLLPRWYHIAYSVDTTAGAHTLYVNGAAVTTASNPNPLLYDWHPLLVGRDLRDNFFYGNLDEVRIWSAARSAAQIQADYNHPLSGTEPGLIACWHFDEGIGPVAYDASTNHLNIQWDYGDLYWSGVTQPTLTRLPDGIVGEAAPVPPIPFQAYDLEDPSGYGAGLSIIADSENPGLVPNTPEALSLGNNLPLQIVPTPSAFGTATIHVTATDGRESAVSSMHLSVMAAPRVSALPDLTIG